MNREDGVSTFHAQDGMAWRNWLKANHAQESSVWLIVYHKGSDTPSVYYDGAVDEALCFGWIDSKPNQRDEESYYQFFSKRNPKSNWSGVNKERVKQLLAQSRMAPAGLAMVEEAKRRGTWTALDEVESLVVPPDLQEALDKNQVAGSQWNEFPPPQNAVSWNGFSMPRNPKPGRRGLTKPYRWPRKACGRIIFGNRSREIKNSSHKFSQR